MVNQFAQSLTEKLSTFWNKYSDSSSSRQQFTVCFWGTPYSRERLKEKETVLAAVKKKKKSIHKPVSDNLLQVPYEAGRHWGWHQGSTECFLCLPRCPGRRQAFPNLRENQPGNASQLTVLDHNSWVVTEKRLWGRCELSAILLGPKAQLLITESLVLKWRWCHIMRYTASCTPTQKVQHLILALPLMNCVSLSIKLNQTEPLLCHLYIYKDTLLTICAL